MKLMKSGPFSVFYYFLNSFRPNQNFSPLIIPLQVFISLNFVLPTIDPNVSPIPLPVMKYCFSMIRPQGLFFVWNWWVFWQWGGIWLKINKCVCVCSWRWRNKSLCSKELHCCPKMFKTLRGIQYIRYCLQLSAKMNSWFLAFSWDFWQLLKYYIPGVMF